MNLMIEQLMNQNFNGFLKLVELGIIDKEIACEAVIESKNAEYIYKIAIVIDINIVKLEDAIIQTGNAKFIFYFARDVKGASIEKLEDAIIQIGNAEFMYDFSEFIEGANIPKLEDAIIQTGNAEFMFYFAKSQKGANIEKLEDAIIQTGDAEWINRYAMEIEGANIEKTKQTLDYIKKRENDFAKLMSLLNYGNYDEIVNNSQEYEQLFIDDTPTKGRS